MVNEKTKIPLLNSGDFTYPDSLTSNGHISLIQAKNLGNSEALEKIIQRPFISYLVSHLDHLVLGFMVL